MWLNQACSDWRVLRGRTARRAQGRAQHHGHFPLAARHVVDFGRLVDHLVHGQGDEVAEHDVHDGPQAGHGRADGDAGKARLGNRRIQHALGAELLHQPGEDLERRAGLRHIFPDDEDARVAAHLFGQGFTESPRQR